MSDTKQASQAPETQKRRGPENKKAADKATQDNDLTTSHNDPDDGRDNNAKK